MEAQDRRRRAPSARNFQRHALHRQPGYVFVCAGRCHCKELWRFKTGEDAEIHNRVGMQSSSRRGRWRDSNVCAVGAKTGKQKWFYLTKGSWVNHSAAVSGDKVLFGTSTPGLLHAVARAHLRTSLGVETKFLVFASIAIADGMLSFGTLDGKFAVVDLKTQKPAWAFSERHAQAETAHNPESRWDLELRGNHVPKLL